MPAPDTAPDDRRALTFAGVDLEVPADLTAGDGQGVDGDVLVADGAGLRLTLDAGPFRDRLHSVASRPGFRRWPPTTDGTEVVGFDVDDGTVLAAHVADALTVTVHVRDGADPATALQILHSIHPTPHRGDPHDR